MLSDLGPTISALLKSTARLTGHEGTLSQLDYDNALSKMKQEISELESKNNCKLDAEGIKNDVELQAQWQKVLDLQLQNAEEYYAAKVMEDGPLGERSTFRNQFRENMEQAVRRAINDERSLYSSTLAWERNFSNLLAIRIKTAEEALKLESHYYYDDRENVAIEHSQKLRQDESVLLTEIRQEQAYVRNKLDSVLDANYATLLSHIQTSTRGFHKEYQKQINDVHDFAASVSIVLIFLLANL